MREIRKHGLFAVGCLLTVFLATGCFQAAGESLQATSVAQGIATFTPIIIPTDTETPTEEPELELITETPAEAAPVDEFEQETPAPAITDTPIVELPLLVSTPTALSAAAVLTEQAIDQQANVVPQIEPPELTATALVQRATDQAALEQTATAEALATPIVPTLPPTAIFPTATIPGMIVTQPVISGGECIHVVSRGENLFRISLRYGTTVHILAADPRNQITNINLIRVGQQIYVPNCGGGTVPTPPPGGGTIHVVMQGENLFRISLRYGVSLNAILAVNPQIVNANLIYINQQIVIPGV